MYFKHSLIIIFLSSFILCFSQGEIGYKDFSQINLDDLNEEGPVGELMMKAHLATDIDSTVYYINKAEKLANKSKDTLLIPYINYHYGYAFFNKQNYTKSETYLNKCILLGKDHNLPGMIYESYNLLALIYKDQTYFNTSLDYFKASLKFAPTKIDSLHLNINISGIYIDTNKDDMAKLYLEEVLEFDANHPNTIDWYWMVYANLNYAEAIQDFQIKLDYIKRAQVLAEKGKDEHVILQTKIKLSELYLNFGKTEQAFDLAKQNLEFAQKYNLTDLISRIRLTLAHVYYIKQDHESALRYLDSIKSKLYPDWMQEQLYQLTYDNLFAIGDKDQAFKIAKKQINYLDSLLQKKEDKAYAEFAKKYETDKKTQENELLKKDNQIKELSLSKEKNRRYLLSALAALILVISIVLYYRYRNKKKVSEILTAKNLTISQQNKELEVANQTKQKFFSIIAHDLINPFNAILGYTNMLENDFNLFSEVEKKQFISIINKQSNQNYKLVKNLLDWARVQQNKIQVQKTQLNIKDIVKHITAAYGVLADKKNIKTIIDIDHNSCIYADKDCLKTIISNIYSNAIKFSKEHGIIKISSQSNVSFTSLTIKDAGVGMSPEQVNNVFNLAKTTSTKGTSNEKGTGFGLLICKELTDLQNGQLTINSSLQNGTTITITLSNR
jgi:signal transduction histidine kinase